MRPRREELPLEAEGNGERLRQIEFDQADAPMLLHALIIGANTALMCGGRQATQRMAYYARLIRDLCPPGHEHLRREEDLCEIALAMREAPHWSFTFAPERWRSNGEAIIRVGKKAWTSAYMITQPQADELRGCIEAIAPLTCTYIDTPE
ncbi:hypothetical protein [Croceicoccus gelatinilyticus]|uniref:hypothetical protein n=1 Tax=Croceicoccus gelatinilyticus TaxID=2835536 RepID=UPI001BCBB5FF|nr:hypothetical protein [Croceicoccus gelatinilyticus]MBS7671674.1 hypothetical protein [Croceicoccus gelatinilyticus]